MSPSVEQQVSALAAPSVTDGLGPTDWQRNPATGAARLFGRPVLTVADAPVFTGTSGAENFLVVGSFARYVTVFRLGGFQVELVPHLRDTVSGRPTGDRAWFASTRFGGDVIDTNAFRILSNT
jgi:HK97 family phage major capsid protein